MAKKLIDRIKKSLEKQGIKPRSDEARQWLQSKITELNPTQSALMADRQRLKTRSLIVKMYFYYYDPKHKDTLPYYDRFPLVIPIEKYNDGFLGLNLHYIHPKYRITLLDKLVEVASNRNYNEQTKLRISYRYLQASSKIFEATPCIKRYLFSHIQSRFLEIQADEWDIAALLPMESFVGATTSKVYAESKDKF